MKKLERIGGQKTSGLPSSLPSVSKARRQKLGEAYGQVLEKVFRSVLQESEAIETQRSTASVLIEELLWLSENQGKLLISNSPRYHNWGVAEELLSRSRGSWADDPSQAKQHAELALEVTENLRVSGFRRKLLNDLKAEGWSYIGNCNRIASNLVDASAAFDCAEEYLAAGSGDSMERARFLDLKSSLLRAQRDLAGAAKLLEDAIRQYRRMGERHLEARALVKQAKLLRDSGRVEESVPLLEEASRYLDSEREPRLLFALKHNLLMFLAELGRTTEAQTLVPEVRELAREHATRQDRLRVLWVDGILRRSVGQVELAEQALTQAREGFVAVGLGYDVALISLDLAALYLDAGRNGDVRRLAVETMPIFASLGVQRELLMAWQLFKEAAEKDAATLRLVNEVADRIRSSVGIGSSLH